MTYPCLEIWYSLGPCPVTGRLLQWCVNIITDYDIIRACPLSVQNFSQLELTLPCNSFTLILLHGPWLCLGWCECLSNTFASDFGEEKFAGSNRAFGSSFKILLFLRFRVGIYPAVDPLDSTSRILDPNIVGAEHYNVARGVQKILQVSSTGFRGTW